MHFYFAAGFLMIHFSPLFSFLLINEFLFYSIKSVISIICVFNRKNHCWNSTVTRFWIIKFAFCISFVVYFRCEIVVNIFIYFTISNHCPINQILNMARLILGLNYDFYIIWDYMLEKELKWAITDDCGRLCSLEVVGVLRRCCTEATNAFYWCCCLFPFPGPISPASSDAGCQPRVSWCRLESVMNPSRAHGA